MGKLAHPVAICGAGAISARGLGWRGLGARVRESACQPAPSRELAASHPGVCSFEVPVLPDPASVIEQRARPWMARSAVLASAATQAALHDALWTAPEDIGFYLGVGASGGSVDQLSSMLGASIDEDGFSLARFGDQGLHACNPLFAFQLMNNFTLCHAAILGGTQGPNAAYFSRGTGTVFALEEAAHAILSHDCERALAGGADSCVQPVTWAELVREGVAAKGLVPGEGAAILALGPKATARARGLLEYCAVESSRTIDAIARIDRAGLDLAVLAPWGPPARDSLCSLAGQLGVPVVDATCALGEALAAAPALAWTVALDLLISDRLRRVLVLSAGLDGQLGVVVFRGVDE